jgi:hypothetical protein
MTGMFMHKILNQRGLVIYFKLPDRKQKKKKNLSSKVNVFKREGVRENERVI